MRGKVLVTGHDGYIGAVLTPRLVRSGYDVVGLDTGYFSKCLLGTEPAKVPTIAKDLREVEASDLKGFDAIVHLGALSNDPVGNLNKGWTEDINFHASVRLAKAAKQAGIKRFIFSSSCIMYGLSEAQFVDENSALNPQTDYARSKVQTEEALHGLADDTFSPVYVRNGTVYGLSPRQRLDTVLNAFVAEALTTGHVTMHSDGEPWRPVVHVDDLARTFELYLAAPTEIIHDQAFNNGADHLNYKIRTIGEAAVKAVPGAKLTIEGRPGADQRTYRASFAKFAKTFPEFKFEWTPESGAVQLANAFKGVGLDKVAVASGKFIRLSWLQHLIDEGRLDGDLKWRGVNG